MAQPMRLRRHRAPRGDEDERVIQRPGARIHRVALDNPVSRSDAEGNPVQDWIPLVPPTLRVSVRAATQRDLERLTIGTVIATATHVIEGPYHAGVTTKTRVTFEDTRLFSVTGVDDVDERHVALVLLCEEVVD